MKITLNTPKEVKLDQIDFILVFFISIVSFCVHLWCIQHPAHVIFDEVHFGNFTNWYTKSEFFFDIHPPLGKIIMFLFANFSEYDGQIEFGGEYGHTYPDETYVPLRITPAFFSSLCPTLLYFAVRFCGFSRCAGLATASIVLFDTSILCEHRFILSDGMLHFFSALHICIMAYGLSLPRDSQRFFVWQILTGLSLGAACSCKNTAWGLIALNGIIHVVEVFLTELALNESFFINVFIRGFTLAVPTGVVYIASFCVHFALLPFIGQGKGYLSQEMQNQLIDPSLDGLQLWGNRVTKPGLVTRSIILTLRMHQGNMGITQWHPYQSRPIGWPLLTDIYVGFWAKDGLEINCIGNVFSYYMAFFGVIFVLFGLRNKKWIQAMRFSVGWAVSYFPFFLIPRTMYLYHYHIPLMIGSCAFGASIDLFCPKFLRGLTAVIACFLAFVGFVLWSSFAYGQKPWDKHVIIWNDNWLYGDSVHRELAKGAGSPPPMNTKGIHIV